MLKARKNDRKICWQQLEMEIIGRIYLCRLRGGEAGARGGDSVCVRAMGAV